MRAAAIVLSVSIWPFIACSDADSGSGGAPLDGAGGAAFPPTHSGGTALGGSGNGGARLATGGRFGSGGNGNAGTPPGTSGGFGGMFFGAGGTVFGTGGMVFGTGGTDLGAGGWDPGAGGAGGTNPSAGGANPGAGGAAAGGSPSGSGGAPQAGAPLVGVYCGNSVSEIQSFESWLGRPVDGILGYTGDASWEDYDGSVGWAMGLWGAIDRRVFWSVPLIPRGASLAAASAGDYDAHYRGAAEKLATYRTQDGELHVRTGWEFNGDWFPWAAKDKANDFIGAFRRFVTVFRSVSNRFVFEWNVNVGDVGMNPEDAYPGDAYVDIIGMDFYWNTQWHPTDPVQAWSQMVDTTWGLAWHQSFAAAHGKRTSYSEWGVRSNDAAYYIEQAEKWFKDHDVVFHSYWDSNNAFPGKLSSGQYPNAGAAYRTAFGP